MFTTMRCTCCALFEFSALGTKKGCLGSFPKEEEPSHLPPTQSQKRYRWEQRTSWVPYSPLTVQLSTHKVLRTENRCFGTNLHDTLLAQSGFKESTSSSGTPERHDLTLISQLSQFFSDYMSWNATNLWHANISEAISDSLRAQGAGSRVAIPMCLFA